MSTKRWWGPCGCGKSVYYLGKGGLRGKNFMCDECERLFTKEELEKYKRGEYDEINKGNNKQELPVLLGKDNHYKIKARN